jgi:hypothetical protein
MSCSSIFNELLLFTGSRGAPHFYPSLLLLIHGADIGTLINLCRYFAAIQIHFYRCVVIDTGAAAGGLVIPGIEDFSKMTKRY